VPATGHEPPAGRLGCPSFWLETVSRFALELISPAPEAARTISQKPVDGPARPWLC
jgi:hypothetical protein